MSFIWLNSTKSDLYNRLADLFIISSYARLLNKSIYLKWKIQSINNIQKAIQDEISLNDYKIENVKQYFIFPNCINIISENDFNTKINTTTSEDVIFNNYLGGQYSPITFYKEFIDNNKYTFDMYINIFNDLINEFKPTEKLLKLILYIPNNLITIHLRELGKSNELVSIKDYEGENTKELNDETINIINMLILNGYNNFYFVSECENTKKEYENLFEDYNILNYVTNINIEKTYIDIYMMMVSKYIILSHPHSKFSLFASLINKSNLIYLYHDSIINSNYLYFKNIIYYKDFEIKTNLDLNKKNVNYKNTNGLLYFHQGWTDIINSLGLINYYCEIYKNIYLLIRKDSSKIIDFYASNIKNLNILYENKSDLDNNNINNFIKKYKLKNIDLLLIGVHDKNRNDNYKNKFRGNKFFVNAFYECYDVDYMNRIIKFDFIRNYELENKTYEKFIKKHGNKYILYHEIIENYDKTIPIINLNKISEVFFDMIKILENAIELHLLDSVWGAFIYQLDCKYKLFQNKKIYIYCKRGYVPIFTEPIKLDNWIISK